MLQELSALEVFVALALVVLALINLGVCYLATERLRDRHPEVWHELGEPTIEGRGITSFVRFAGFVVNGGHRSLGDSTLSALCRAIYAPLVLSLLLVGLTLAVFGALLVSLLMDAILGAT